ncbi:hypothetical protein [Geodermatophilus sp. SYSU D01105]
MTAAPLPTTAFALRDIEDLAEADLEADLAERMAAAGWVLSAPADVQALAQSIGEAAADAVAAHTLDPWAVALLG